MMFNISPLTHIIHAHPTAHTAHPTPHTPHPTPHAHSTPTLPPGHTLNIYNIYTHTPTHTSYGECLFACCICNVYTITLRYQRAKFSR